MYFTLDELAVALADGSTAASLLRRAVTGDIVVCAYFEGKFQSLIKHRVIDVAGLYIVPPRYLGTIDAAGAARCDGVFSVDTADTIAPFQMLTSPQLRVTAAEFARVVSLGDQISPIAKSGVAQSEAAQWSDAELDDMRALRTNKVSDAEIGRRHGISRQRVAELIGSKTSVRLEQNRRGKAQG